jgi:hypothetical protein
MRGGATEVNETQKWATSKKRLRTTGVAYSSTLNMEAIRPAETWVDFYRTARCNSLFLILFKHVSTGLCTNKQERSRDDTYVSSLEGLANVTHLTGGDLFCYINST